MFRTGDADRKCRVFCIDREGYTQEEANDIAQVIESHGGQVIDENIENSVATHMVHPDGGSHVTDLDADKGKNGKYNVSHRFIYRCVQEQKFIRI